MNEVLMLTLAGLAGVALGLGFFGGLWWTVGKGISSPQPALWLLGSGLLRMAVAVTGFYFVSAHHWQRLLICLGGFTLARAVVTHWTRSFERNRNRLATEASHAP